MIVLIKKIIETKKDNRLVIIEDTKPSIDKDTKTNIEINKKTLLKSVLCC